MIALNYTRGSKTIQVPRYSSILRIYRYMNDLGDKPTVTAAAVCCSASICVENKTDVNN